MVTIKDVAAHAGVSVATVSRVLSGRRSTDDDLTRRVRIAADDLDYAANYLGRALRGQRTDTIGLIVPDLTHPFFPELVQRIERQARLAGSTILLADTLNDPAQEAELVEALIRRQVDGILVSATDARTSATLIDGIVGRVPVVLLDRVAGDRADRVLVDPLSAMAVLAGRAAARGAATAAYVGGGDGASTWRSRREAFATAFGARDPGAPGRTITTELTVEAGREAARAVRERWPAVRTIVCGSDMQAFGVVQELQALGLDVPGEILVSGWDDGGFALASRPALTSVRQPLDAIAEAAVGMLAAERGGGGTTSRTFDAEVVVRESL
jgi:LacI family transcriptional regulator